MMGITKAIKDVITIPEMEATNNSMVMEIHNLAKGQKPLMEERLHTNQARLLWH